MPQMAANFADDRITLIERFAIRVIKKMLARFSLKNNKSEEVLNYGFHLVAGKL